MSVYRRTSLKAGPFQLNLSSAGIGVSAAIPGFRIGTSPRSNYVRIDGQGSRYSSTVLSGPPVHGHHPPPAAPTDGEVLLHELAGTSIQHLVAAHPSDIVAQLEAVSRRVSIWPFAAGFLVLATLLTLPFGLALLLAGVPAVIWLRLRDIARQSVVVFYRVDDEPAARFDRLIAAHGFSCQAHRCWHIEAQGSLVTPYQRKVNAGAAAIIRRNISTLTLDGPSPLVTNVAVPTLHSKSRSVYFLPDRALVRDGPRYAELPYSSLQAMAQPQQFIEYESVPGDARTVGTTWRYTNTKGGPDRRFKNNRQLPVMLYGRLTLTTQSGFLMTWDFSRPEIADALANAIRDMRQTTSRS